MSLKNKNLFNPVKMDRFKNDKIEILNAYRLA